jgi:cell division septation protein DedD
MADEGFHEIQLGKKQLFFAFMAAALYSVVVFSLGVWVGQDVRRPESELAAETSPDTPADSTPEPTKIAPNELDYSARLQSDGKGAPAAETKPAEPPPTPPDTAATTEVKTPPPAAPENKAAAAPAPAAKAGNVVVQAAAFNDKKTADSLVTRLKAKGYAAFVFTADGVPFGFKVRVGPLADMAEADKVMARLKKEERLAPFISR